MTSNGMSVYDVISQYLDGLIGKSIIVDGWRKPRVLKSWADAGIEDMGYYFTFQSGEKKYVGIDEGIRVVPGR